MKNSISENSNKQSLNIQKAIKVKNKKTNKCITKKINTQRGINRENKNLDDYEKKYNKKVIKRNDQFYNLLIYRDEYIEVNICGKIDGIED